MSKENLHIWLHNFHDVIVMRTQVWMPRNWHCLLVFMFRIQLRILLLSKVKKREKAPLLNVCFFSLPCLVRNPVASIQTTVEALGPVSCRFIQDMGGGLGPDGGLGAFGGKFCFFGDTNEIWLVSLQCTFRSHGSPSRVHHRSERGKFVRHIT